MTSRAALVLSSSIFLALVVAPSAARANQGITGYAGKPYFGVASTCETTCHTPTTPVPSLTVTVPTTVQAGSTSEVTVVVDGTRQRTSINAAFSDGVKATAGQNTEIPFPLDTPGEVAAVAPPPNGPDGTYKFTFEAPKTNGTITLWVVGMSTNYDGTNGGDAVAKTTRTITVTGGTAPAPDAGSAPSDAGGGTDDDAGGGGGPGSPSVDGSAPGSSSGATGSSSSGAPERRLAGEDDGGCSSAPAGASSPAGAGASGLAAALSLLAVRRSRRRPAGEGERDRARRTPLARGRS